MSERQASNFRKATYTDSQTALMARLNREKIDFKSEFVTTREYEYTKEGKLKHHMEDVIQVIKTEMRRVKQP